MSFLAQPTLTKFPDVPQTPWEEFLIQDFSGGLCSAFPETTITDNQFTSLNNYYLKNNGSLVVRGRYVPYGAPSTLDTVLGTAPQTFHWSQIGTTDALLASRVNGSDSVVEWWNSTAWASVKTFTGSSAKKTQFINYSINDQQDVIFFNGSDTPQRWTGSSTSSDLGLGTPEDDIGSVSLTANSSVGEGIRTSGTYYYKFTYFYESSTTTKYGESNPSSTTKSIAVTVSANDYQKVLIEDLPSLPTGVSRIYVFRSQADNEDGIYRQVGYTKGTSFTDSTPNGEEGADLPIDDGSVPALKNAIVFKGRIWGVDGALPTKAVWTPKGQPDIFLALDYAYFPDELIGPAIFNENIYWFTTKQIYVTPNGDVDTYPEPLKLCDRGATSFESIADVGNGLCFQGEHNIYWVDFNTHSLKDGDYPIPIGEPIQDKMEDIPASYRTNSIGCYYKDRYYISYTGKNQTVNTATLVWDVELGTRKLHQGQFGAWTTVGWVGNYLQNFEGSMYSANNLTNFYVMVHDTEGTIDYDTENTYTAGSGGNNIITELASKRLHFEHEWTDKIIHSVSIATETSGITYDMSLSCGGEDYSNNYTKSKIFELGSSTPTVDSTWLVWEQGTWNNFNWASSNYGFHSGHKGFGDIKCKNAKLSLTSSDSQDTSLALIKIYYKQLPPPA